MIWALSAVLSLLAIFAIAWWGSNIVFHPPKWIPLTVWPDQFGLRYEAVSFRTKDGLTLKGWLIPAARSTDRTILMCHGWGDNKGDLLSRVAPLSEDFNLFFFDSRAHGESEGKLSTIGYLEAADFDAAFEFIKTRKPECFSRLGVFGLSMGAAMAVYGSAHHPEIRCAAIESPFRSFNRVVTQFGWNAYRFPYFPLSWATLAVIRCRLGADPEPFSPIYHIARLAPRSTLFIAASKDRLMPLAEVRALYEAAPDPKELWVVEGAEHSRCHEVAGPEYARRLASFFEKNLR